VSGPIIREERIGNQRLLMGDCISIMPTLGRFDAVVTDPPYGIGAAKAGAHSSIRDNQKWDKKSWDDSRPTDECFIEVLGVAPEAIIWGGNYFADLLPASPGWLSWRKPQAESGFSLADIELAWTSRKMAARQITLPRRDGNQHPTQKPVALMEWCLGFLPDAKTILDPFAGSGTTAVACERMGRHCTAIELDPVYFEIMCKRVDEAARQPDMFVETPAAPMQEDMQL
jgi:DNA modification methylase